MNVDENPLHLNDVDVDIKGNEVMNVDENPMNRLHLKGVELLNDVEVAAKTPVEASSTNPCVDFFDIHMKQRHVQNLIDSFENFKKVCEPATDATGAGWTTSTATPCGVKASQAFASTVSRTGNTTWPRDTYIQHAPERLMLIKNATKPKPGDEMLKSGSKRPSQKSPDPERMSTSTGYKHHLMKHGQNGGNMKRNEPNAEDSAARNARSASDARRNANADGRNAENRRNWIRPRSPPTFSMFSHTSRKRTNFNLLALPHQLLGPPHQHQTASHLRRTSPPGTSQMNPKQVPQRDTGYLTPGARILFGKSTKAVTQTNGRRGSVEGCQAQLERRRRGHRRSRECLQPQLPQHLHVPLIIGP